jgi:imidazolonepropionase-like amidohydrolase
VLDCAADPDAIRGAILRGEGARPPFTPQVILRPMRFRAMDTPFYQRVLETYDPARCEALAMTFARAGTWHVPSLIRLKAMNLSGDAAVRNDPELRYVDKATRAEWIALGQRFADTMPPVSTATFRAFYQKQATLVPLLHKAGVKMLAGSDLGGIWVVPGAGLHAEFRELAAAGLSPLGVLCMATLNAGEFLRRGDAMGAVEAGMQADLVVLDANPLADVANLGKISGVVLKGTWLPGVELERSKEEAVAAGR